MKISSALPSPMRKFFLTLRRSAAAAWEGGSSGKTGARMGTRTCRLSNMEPGGGVLRLSGEARGKVTEEPTKALKPEAVCCFFLFNIIEDHGISLT